MRTLVTSYTNDLHCLETFLSLTKRFYSPSIDIDVATINEPKSNQLIRILESIDNNYIIILESDFYLISSVDSVLLQQIHNFCEDNEVDRFSLQSKDAHQFSDWPQTKYSIDGLPVYKTSSSVVIPFSLEASIWKREFLLNNLDPNQNDAQIEVICSAKIRHTNHKIYALNQIVMHYRDGIRDGQRIIHLHNNPLQLTVQPEHSSALFPLDPTSTETVLLL